MSSFYYVLGLKNINSVPTIRRNCYGRILLDILRLINKAAVLREPVDRKAVLIIKRLYEICASLSHDNVKANATTVVAGELCTPTQYAR